MSSFPNCMSLVSFSCLIALARTSSTKLTSYGMSGQPCLVPHFSGTVLSFSPFNLCWLLAWCKLPLFSYVPCIPNLFIYGVRFFFSNAFPAFNEMIMWFSSVCLYGELYLQIFMYWTIPASLEWVYFGWSFWYVHGFSFQIFYWIFLYHCS